MKFILADVVARCTTITMDYFQLEERNIDPTTGLSTWTTVMGDEYVLDEGQLVELNDKGVAWLKVQGQPDREAVFSSGSPVNATFLTTRGVKPAN